MDERSRTKRLPGEKNKTRGFDITIPVLALFAIALFALPYKFTPKIGLAQLLLALTLAGTTVFGLWRGALRVWLPQPVLEMNAVKLHGIFFIVLLVLFSFAVNNGIGVAITAMTGERFQEAKVVHPKKRIRKSWGCRYYLTDDTDVNICINYRQYRAYQGAHFEVLLRGRRSSWGTLIDHLELPPATTTN